ncbi:hypothetical protein J8273_8235 [Carpediemonas membranifera]|uniref:Uncharacterized protein n=1 Tax=Carpediemonas membranifera TaxID=201153 RepID=A0A8J6AS90_9EUKA|nr:hypothetical protein J8273_8235 [Carpediemonas membranifera]|eukprot:KAG9390195.1 hypothetical protein J8273_8235 [Carpediemonas membranifera]
MQNAKFSKSDFFKAYDFLIRSNPLRWFGAYAIMVAAKVATIAIMTLAIIIVYGLFDSIIDFCRDDELGVLGTFLEILCYLCIMCIIVLAGGVIMVAIAAFRFLHLTLRVCMLRTAQGQDIPALEMARQFGSNVMTFSIHSAIDVAVYTLLHSLGPFLIIYHFFVDNVINFVDDDMSIVDAWRINAMAALANWQPNLVQASLRWVFHLGNLLSLGFLAPFLMPYSDALTIVYHGRAFDLLTGSSEAAGGFSEL